MQKTGIEWTDFTANPIKYRDAAGNVVWACVKTSPGCTHCYAEALAKRYGRGGPFKQSVMDGLTPFLDEKELRKMLTYKPASGARCFIGDMTDVFGEWVPDEMLDRLFAAFAARPDVTWQVLTKRADRLAKYMAGDVHLRMTRCFVNFREYMEPVGPWPLSNVWIGVSVEDQQRADERIPSLLRTRAAVRFLSCEPLLGKLNLRRYFAHSIHCGGMVRPGHFMPSYCDCGAPNIHWCIVGGESGGGSRECRAEWVRDIVKQCQSARVPAFVKQMGSKIIDRNDAGFSGDEPDSWPESLEYGGNIRVEHNIHGFREEFQGADVRIHLPTRKGGEPSEWPEDLRIRQFPVSA